MCLKKDHEYLGDHFTDKQLVWWYQKIREEEMEQVKLQTVTMVNSIGLALGGKKGDLKNYLAKLSPKKKADMDATKVMHKTLDNWKALGLPIKDTV